MAIVAEAPQPPPLAVVAAAAVTLAPGVELSTPRPGVRVVAVDRSRARLRVVSAHDQVPGLERPSAMARRTGAVAGVNGGFFAVGPPDAGDPVGVVADRGELLSEPAGARTALRLPADPAAPATIGPVRWRATLTAGDTTRRLVDGVNRNRGRIPACGGVGGDRPTQRLDPAQTCTDPSELVVLTPAFGPRTRTAAPGVEAVVRRGTVTAVRRARNTRIPRDGYVLSGSGDAARFLRDHVRPGDAPALATGVAPGESVLGGAPRLLDGGRIRITARREGRGADTGRVPRTLAAVRPDGTVLLVTLAAATLREAAHAARALGAADAVGLDSGGSTSMTVRGQAPADERPVANGLFALP